ncbi:malate dehydrogenase [Thiofilum flexile]|uniref:malate dehydrogenase n=1 Tax=Thiofilum flexile TaxID=125627 RepID=UPI00037E44DD|nr:malate dehydrogenase [Thiofilum flexile]
MKVTIVGAGNVGATCARALANREVASDLVMIDIKPGVAEGKALDMWQTSAVQLYDTRINGYTGDYEKTRGSEVVVITSGLPRKPGMSRDDLITTNAVIVQEVTREIIRYSPDAKIIVVSNPLDVMTYAAYLAAHKPSNQVFGMAGVLDTARFKSFIAMEMNVSPKEISATLMGGHGDSMVPLPRYTTISGIPLTELMSAERIEAIVQRTIHGGAEIVNLMGTSAWYAPGAAAAYMVETILRGSRKIVPTSAWLEGEYGLSNIYFGVPVILGRNGVERVIQLQLNDAEMELVHKSAASVKETMNVLDQMGQS